MDRKHFDALARFVATKTTRRSAFAALVGASLAGGVPGASDAKNNHAKRRRRRRRRRNRGCYPGTTCVPGRSSKSAGCDFSGSTAFEGADLRFANLAGANLSNINAMNADLRGADLRGACIVESVLFEAQLGTAKLDGAIFCNTVMPDGTINTSGCEQATECCPSCASGDCPPRGTCAPLGNICSLLPFGDKCCNDAKCVPPVPSKYWWVTWCQDTNGCSTTDQCKSRFPDYDVTCMDDDFLGCPGLVPRCCRMKECLIDDHCPHSGVCCSFLNIGIARCCAPGKRCTLIGCL